MSEKAKYDAVALAQTMIFGAILFTASMDCGVSIEILGYDLVIGRLGSRSVGADLTMQISQRVRHLKEGKIVFVCDALVKDWGRYPCYNHNIALKNGKPMKKLPAFIVRHRTVLKECKNIPEVKRKLHKDNNQEDEVYWLSKAKKTWYVRTR